MPFKAVDTAKLDDALETDLSDALEKMTPEKRAQILKALDQAQLAQTEVKSGAGGMSYIPSGALAQISLSKDDDPVLLVQALAKDHPIARIAIRHEMSHLSRIDSQEKFATEVAGRKNGLFREEVAAWGDQYDYTRKVYKRENLAELKLTYPSASVGDLDQLLKAGILRVEGERKIFDFNKINHDRTLGETTARVLKGDMNDSFRNYVTKAVTQSKSDFVKSYVGKEEYIQKQNDLIISGKTQQVVDFIKWSTPAIAVSGANIYENSKEAP